MKKINWLLILQAWAILWVVIGHSPMSLDNMPNYVGLLYGFAYSFHMPLFIMISGYLFCMTRLQPQNDDDQGWTWTEIMRDKLIRLGIPYFVFTIFAMILKSLFPEDMERPIGISSREFVNAILYPGDGPLGELWFIAVLMWGFLLTPIWRLALRRKSVLVLVSTVLLITHLLHLVTDIDIHLLSISNALRYLIWFYVGILLYKYNIAGSFNGIVTWICMLFSGLVLYILLYPFAIKDLLTILAILMSYGIARLLDVFIPSAFKSFRNYTYQIYLMGIFAQIGVKMLYKRIDIPYLLAYIVCIIAGLYIPVLISVIVKKIDFKPLSVCLGLK